MLARLQQALTIGLAFCVVAWAVAFWRAGSPVWAIAGALLLGLGYAVVLAAEFIVMQLVNRGDPAPPARWSEVALAWWREVRAAPRVFCWQQPFRSRAEPDTVHEPGVRSQRGVVFIHGFVCNRGLWNPWLRRLRAQHVPYVAVNLEPVFGSIDAYVGEIEAAVACVEAATGCAPVLVAHSMGGLVARAWMNRCSGDLRVHRVITIGTPHRGTWLGRFGHTPNARQMRLDAQWHQDLLGREPTSRCELFTCFYSHCDNIVFPASTATLPGADNRHIRAAPHVGLAFHPAAYVELLRWL